MAEIIRPLQSAIHTSKRVVYIEPNDIFGSINGVPVTPDYSDYCISVNLIAEVVPRIRQSGGSNVKTAMITYTTKPVGLKSEEENKWVSFLHGEDVEKLSGKNDVFSDGSKKGSLLTTFYTDVNAEDIIKKNIVEGLGIESIQVSFESYYTPTVTIKFVDVRGASLMGREEASHNENEELTANSVFGVFFTVPYPKFKLQIKGFYGHGVTYQLTCSDFRASFNSKTGNFEATATFIGYSYSLLTDIPFEYLVAAPDCKYVGESYWAERKNSVDWRMSTGAEPKKFKDFFKEIQGAIQHGADSQATQVQTNEKATLTTQSSYLGEIKDRVGNVKAILRGFTPSNVNAVYTTHHTDGEEGDEEQVLVFAKSEGKDEHIDIKVPAEPGKQLYAEYETMKSSFNEYNNNTEGKISDKWLPKLIFNGSESERKVSFRRMTKKTVTGEVILNDNLGLSAESVKKLNEIYGGKYPTDLFILVTDFYGFEKYLQTKKDEIAKRLNDIEKDILRKVEESAGEKLGYRPTIGNIFKMIMCHLETFIHMMWECYHTIDEQMKNNERLPQSFNIDLSKTDIAVTNANASSEQNICPWAGFFGFTNQTDQGGDTDSTMDSIAWIGDFKNGTEEEKLVRAIYKAINRGKTDISTSTANTVSMAGFPVLPNDANNSGYVFSPEADKTFEGLAGYLAMRAASIFGVMLKNGGDNTLAAEAGVMDAFNYYMFLGNQTDINKLLTEYTPNGYGSFSDAVVDIATCSGNALNLKQTAANNNKSFVFENCKSISSHYSNNGKPLMSHPIFTKKNGKLLYSHFYRKVTNGEKEYYVGMIPDLMSNYKGYVESDANSGLFKKEALEDVDGKSVTEFTPTSDGYNSNSDWTSKPIIYKTSSTTYLKDIDGVGDKVYTNPEMFSIDGRQKYIQTIVDKQSTLSSGSFNVLGDTFSKSFPNLLEKLWHVDNGYYSKYLTDMANYLCYPLDVSDPKFKPLPLNDSDTNGSYTASSMDDDAWLTRNGGEFRYDVETGKWKSGKTDEVRETEELVVRFPSSWYYYSNKDGDEIARQCLFSDVFYYLQNDLVKIGELAEDALLDKSRYAKTLIFLHSLSYNYSKLPDFLSKSKANGGIYMLPKGMPLLLGGLLWRQKFYDKYGADPINSNKHEGGNTYFMEVGIENSLFVKDGESYKLYVPAVKNGEGVYRLSRCKVKVSTLFGSEGEKSWMPDECITNKLIEEFKNFANNEFKSIETLAFVSADGKLKYQTARDIFVEFKKEYRTAYKETNAEERERLMKGAVTYIREKLPNFDTHYDNVTYFDIKQLTDEKTRGWQGMILHLRENDTAQQFLKAVYADKVIVADTCGYYHQYGYLSTDNDIMIDENVFRAYLSSFEETLKEIVGKATQVPTYDETGEYDDIPKDMLITCYMYLKILWDRWLVSMTEKTVDETDSYGVVHKRSIKPEDYFNVENFFKNNFIFIDAYYRNIYNKFIINCQTLLDSYIERDEHSSLFNFIGDITKAHNCLFLGLPDYVNIGTSDQSKLVKAMGEMFTPIPFNKMNDLNDENKFVIIYTPRASEIPTEKNNFRSDYFRIWNPDIKKSDGEWGWFDDSMPNTFNQFPYGEDGDDEVTRYGYHVPSFGVAFSRQNNHLFKTVDLTMSSPLVTSASIDAMSRIAKMGSGASHKIALIGQDLYPVYSNYSYIAEIEMMGDAQIQPLMYFQLMNIPMWSGAYMIFNVTHTITPGNMTTKFRGMKLSRNPVPYNSSWFCYNYGEGGDFNESGDIGGGYISGDSILPNVKYQAQNDSGDHYHNKNNWQQGDPQEVSKLGIHVSKEIVSLYNKLYNEIAALPGNEKDKGNMTWNVCLTSTTGGEHSDNSQHYRGCAMDLKISRFKNGSDVPYDKSGPGLNCRELLIVLDILYELHRDKLSKVIFEYYKENGYRIEDVKYCPKCLHVGVKEPKIQDLWIFMDNAHFEWRCSEGKHNKGSKKHPDALFTNENNVCTVPEFIQIASKCYKSNKSNFRNIFRNFEAADDKWLDSLFNRSLGTSGNPTATVFNYHNYSFGKPAADELKRGMYLMEGLISRLNITIEQAAGFAGVGYCESIGCNPTAVNSEAYEKYKKNIWNYYDAGLMQWTEWRDSGANIWKSRKYKLFAAADGGQTQHPKAMEARSFDQQLDFIAWEMKGEHGVDSFKNVYKTLTDKAVNNPGDVAVMLAIRYTGLPKYSSYYGPPTQEEISAFNNSYSGGNTAQLEKRAFYARYHFDEYKRTHPS